MIGLPPGGGNRPRKVFGEFGEIGFGEIDSPQYLNSHSNGS